MSDLIHSPTDLFMLGVFAIVAWGAGDALIDKRPIRFGFFCACALNLAVAFALRQWTELITDVLQQVVTQ